jgi:hypothetical protein
MIPSSALKSVLSAALNSFTALKSHSRRAKREDSSDYMDNNLAGHRRRQRPEGAGWFNQFLRSS